jgi:hypothetical protein
MTLTILRRRADALCKYIAKEDPDYTADEVWEEAVTGHQEGSERDKEGPLFLEWSRLNDLVGQINDAEQAAMSCC